MMFRICTANVILKAFEGKSLQTIPHLPVTLRTYLYSLYAILFFLLSTNWFNRNNSPDALVFQKVIFAPTKYMMPSCLTFIQASICFSSFCLLGVYLCKQTRNVSSSFSKFLLYLLTPWSSLKTKQSKILSLLVCQDQLFLRVFSLFLVCLHSSFVSGLIFRLWALCDRGCLFWSMFNAEC